jgi:D-amino peptidase
MRIFISTDIEGLSGIPSWDWWKNNIRATTEILLRHILPVIEVIKEYDESAEIVIVDSHSKGENMSVLDFPERYSNIFLVNGFPRRDYMMSGFDDTYDGVIFVGYHSLVGGGGAMDHTYSSSSIYDIRINGEPVGETAINAAFAGEFGVPVMLVVGQREMEWEMKRYLPDTVFVPVQEAVGRFATKNMLLHEVDSRIQVGTREAIEKLQKGLIRPFTFASPIEVEIDWLSSSIADVVSQMPIMERISPRTTRYTVSSWIEGFRWLLSAVYMSYLGQR